ncbi:MAG: peptidoglycan synthetase, partial [Ginsengibacter sp.]
DIRYVPYSLPTYFIENGITSVMIEEEKTDLKVFGNHNLLNITAAYYVCRELNVNAHVFSKAIASFTGASSRLELLDESREGNIYRDFAHAPSKVTASVDAMKQQFPGRRLIAILELHTFSSLNENFMNEYRGALENADEAIVFYSSHALEIKRLPLLNVEKVKEGFGKQNLEIITSREELEKRLVHTAKSNANFLFMSSGSYEGMNILQVIKGDEDN